MSSTVDPSKYYRLGNHAWSPAWDAETNPGRAWRDGMVSGNGEQGYVCSGSPYADCFIFQNMWFNFPSADPRSIPPELPGQLAEARQNVLAMNDQWKIKFADGSTRKRTFLYSFHPGHQLRLGLDERPGLEGYIRWTNHETAETGVRFCDTAGEWIRSSFTSRIDNVTVTRISRSSTGQKLHLTISLDDISGMYKAHDGDSKLSALRYKKVVEADADHLSLVAHYPAYSGSELAQGGYAGLTRVIVVNGSKRRILLSARDEAINVGSPPNPAIRVVDADEVYLITRCARTRAMGEMSDFAAPQSHGIIDELALATAAVAERYRDAAGGFDYAAALQAHAAVHAAEYGAVQLNLEQERERDRAGSPDNRSLLLSQKAAPKRLLPALAEQVYRQARYAMVCCGGSSAPRLYGLWIGEWNPGWRAIYTLDANVNLQVAAMNTGHFRSLPLGYITFFLRNAPDFEYNARMAYGMHDAIQVSVNSDIDRAMHVEYDNDYPFQYWNAGASWCLLPIFEYWQCFGNRRIPIQADMRIDDLQRLLGVADGGLTDDEFRHLKEGGALDLERDILLPLLTKQANFWEQLCTPEYYTDRSGNARYQEGKAALAAGEKYLLIPGYSPENCPIGYCSTLTANATMDIAAARDGLQMVMALEKAVSRRGHEAAIARWQTLLDTLPAYQLDSDGALREWAMNEYIENNNHRHLSHLYPVWPAYEARSDLRLARAADLALRNREAYNTGDATAGHGWMHKALVYARLKNGAGLEAALLPLLTQDGYYDSLMTDHDTNRRNDSYCTDTLFGTMAAINEALLYSDADEIEILPALPAGWKTGSIHGLRTRSGLEVSELSWDIPRKSLSLRLEAQGSGAAVKLRSGLAWASASRDGKPVKCERDEGGEFIPLALGAGESLVLGFELS